MSRIVAASLLLSASTLAGCYASEFDERPPDRVEGEFVIGISEDGSESRVVALADELGMTLVRYRGLDRTALLTTSDDDEASVIAALQSSEVVDFAEPHYLYYSERTPNDYGEYLWGLENSGLNGGVTDADIDAFDAWDISTGEGILVAVIDTGLDTTHDDLAPNVWVNPGEIPGNNRDDDGNGYVDDIHGWDFVWDDPVPDDLDGHGTHVAGTVAARGDDGYGVVGTAYRAQVMGLKFLEGRRGGSTYDAAAAIHYAVNQGADVINASWGGPGYSTTLRNAIQYARSRGVVFVTAAGNESSDNDRYASYPANYDVSNVVSVGSTDRRDRLSGFSNYGDRTVDLGAPGSSIVSTIPGDDWGYQSGTSMASPMVAGVAALMLSAQPSLTAEEVREGLMQSVDVLSGGGSWFASAGRVNAFSALQAVGAVPLPPENDPGQNDPEDPGQDEPAPPAAEWTFVPFPVESPHPYTNDFSGWVGVEAPEEATRMRLHFTHIQVESGYDYVTVKDAGGDTLHQWTGNVGSVVSPVLPSNSVTLHLYTDGSVTDWGLALAGFSWR